MLNKPGKRGGAGGRTYADGIFRLRRRFFREGTAELMGGLEGLFRVLMGTCLVGYAADL